MSETLKVQISRTVREWIDGTDVGQSPTADRHVGTAAAELVNTIDSTPITRKDGTITVDLTRRAAIALARIADGMVINNEHERYDSSARGDWTAGRTMLKRLAEVGIRPTDDDDDDGDDDGLHRVDVESCNNCDAVGPVVADDPRGYCADCIADTDDPPEVMFYERNLDADDRLVLQPHHDRIVVKDRGDIYLALPYSPGPLPSGTALVISIRDSSPTETVRTTRPIDELSWLIAEALDRAETMGRYPHADQIGIYVEDVTTIAG